MLYVQTNCKMFINVIICSEMLWDVQKCCEMFRNVVKCSKMLWNVQKCCEMFINVVKCSKMLWNVQKCFEMLKEWKTWNKELKSEKQIISESLRTFGTMYEHSGLFSDEFGTTGLVQFFIICCCFWLWNVVKRSEMLWNVQKCCETFRSVAKSS